MKIIQVILGENRDLNSTNRFLLDTTTGILISFLTVVVGGWYFHYLPVVALVHGLLLGVLYGILRIGVGQFVSPPWADRCLIGLVALYLLVWLTQFSSLMVWSQWTRFWVSSLCLLVLFAIVRGLRELVDRWQGTIDRRLVTGGLVFLIVGLLAIKVLGVIFIPYGMVDQLALHVNPISSGGWIYENLRYVLYPFSVSMDTGLERFPWLTNTPNSNDHVFFVVLDSLRKDMIGSDIGQLSLTPTLDSVRRNGTFYDNYYVQAPWTKPSTASLFTGRYLREHGTFNTWTPSTKPKDDRFYGQELPERFSTLAERLSDQGYSTFGAVSIPHIDSFHQFDQGFDRWFDPTENYNEDYAAVQRLLFWLLHDQPDQSFSYLHLLGPHYPYAVSLHNQKYWENTTYLSKDGLSVPSERFSNPKDLTPAVLPKWKENLKSEEIQYLRHLYRAKLNLWDREIVAPLVQGLRNAGLLSRNHLIVTGDHGEELFDYKLYGHINNPREMVLSPPLLITGPKFKVGHNSDLMVESIDLGATLIDLADVQKQFGSGRSFLGSKGTNERHSRAFSELGQKVVLEQGVKRDRIELDRNSVGVNIALIREGPWKLYHHYESQQEVLIDLPEDPGELKNIPDQPDVQRRLRRGIFNVLGNEKLLTVDPPPLLRARDEQIRNLKGLGYLQ